MHYHDTIKHSVYEVCYTDVATELERPAMQ